MSVSSGHFRNTHRLAWSLPWLDPREKRSDDEVVGQQRLVLVAGCPDVFAVGSVNLRVVPHDRPRSEGTTPSCRAEGFLPFASHRGTSHHTYSNTRQASEMRSHRWS